MSESTNATETADARPGAKRTRSTPPDEPGPGLFEVLTRRPNGHESVHRLRAKDPDTATEHVLSLGIDPADVVDVRRVA